MAILAVELSEALTEFIDREVTSGGFHDRGEFVRVILALRMLESEGKDKECECFLHRGKPIMTAAQEARFEKSLLLAQEEFERGECSTHQPGDARRMLEQLLRQRKEFAEQPGSQRALNGHTDVAACQG